MGQFAGGFETGAPPTDAFAGQQTGGYAAVPMGDPNAYAATTAGYDQSGGANNPFAAPATYQAPAY